MQTNKNHDGIIRSDGCRKHAYMYFLSYDVWYLVILPRRNMTPLPLARVQTSVRIFTKTSAFITTQGRDRYLPVCMFTCLAFGDLRADH